MKQKNENLHMPSGSHSDRKSVCHLTTVHPRNDTRIFIKEAQTLATLLSIKCILMVADGKGHEDKGQTQVSIHDLGRLGSSRLGRAIVGSLKAFLAIRILRPMIIHFHDPELIPLGLLLKGLGYKVIYDIHEDYPGQTLSKHYLPLIIRKPLASAIHVTEMLGAKTFDAIVTATPKIALRFSVNKTVVVQNFPITGELHCSSQIAYVQRQLSFVYVGVIAAIRGALEMVQAIGLLSDKPDVRLDLAGTFSPHGLAETLGALPGWSSVNYHGQVSRDHVANLLNNARAGLVLFHPMPNHVNAQPNKMFEYMSAGVPVIASDFSLWRSIIGGARCGVLVDPMNPKEIGEAMTWVLDHPTEAEAMGLRGRQAVESTYNWNIEAAKLIVLYKHLMDKNTNYS